MWARLARPGEWRVSVWRCPSSHAQQMSAESVFPSRPRTRRVRCSIRTPWRPDDPRPSGSLHRSVGTTYVHLRVRYSHDHAACFTAGAVAVASPGATSRQNLSSVSSGRLARRFQRCETRRQTCSTTRSLVERCTSVSSQDSKFASRYRTRPPSFTNGGPATWDSIKRPKIAAFMPNFTRVEKCGLDPRQTGHRG